MRRVLIIEPAASLWGSERALLDFIPHLVDMEVAVCCPPQRPLVAELRQRAIRVLPYFIHSLHEKSRWLRLLAAFGVLRACLEFRPDVIYLNQSGCYRVVLPASVLLSLPVVAHVRIFEDTAYLASRRPSARRLRSIIAISAAIHDELRRYPELDKIAIHRHYDAYAPFAGEKRSSQRTGHRIACAGRIVPNKGQRLLIEAMACLQSSCNVECLMIRDGQAEFVQALKQLALQVGDGCKVTWTGTRSDIVPLLGTCVALVCPSYHEALGRVIFEAWDAGAVPIVHAKSGGAAEIITAADAGITYSGQEPQILAHAIRDVLQMSPDEIGRMVDNGRRWLWRNCDVKAYGRSIAGILADACPAKARWT